MKNYKDLNTEISLNIENRIFENLNNGEDFFTEVYNLLNSIGVTVEDLDIAGLDFILNVEFGVNITVNEEEENYDNFSPRLARFIISALDLGYRRFLENKKG
jgi:hypothetical protein